MDTEKVKQEALALVHELQIEEARAKGRIEGVLLLLQALEKIESAKEGSQT